MTSQWRTEASEAYADLDQLAGDAPAAARLDAIHAARQLGVAIRKQDRVTGE